MLTFVGLGLYDERSIAIAGQEAIRRADRVFAEFYTGRLAGVSTGGLEAYHEKEIEVRDRDGVESDPEPILSTAGDGHAAFLTAGDPMVSTTHIDLRLRAHDQGIETRIVHGTSAQSAASGLTGLQNYRFGKATTLPFPRGNTRVPDSVIDTIRQNRDRGLHTLVYLDTDTDTDQYLSASEGAGLLATGFDDIIGVGVPRAGSPAPMVQADALSALAGYDFGGPLHLLVVPGELHHMEAEALRALANPPDDLLPR